jgi:Zn-dependent protease with chaperone function
MRKLFQRPSPRNHPSLRVVPALLLCVALAGFAAAQSPQEPFRFGDVDLEFLDQIKRLDKKFEEQALVYREPQLNAYIDRLGRSLLKPEDQLENVVWQFHVMRKPTINAFAMPNGSIYVHTGLLARMENEAQLASVLSHEIIHVRNRHSYLEYRSYRKKALAANIITMVGALGGADIGMAAQLMLTLSVLGYNREREKEADLEGARLMASSPYEPKEMVAALECLLPKYEVDLYGEPPSIYSDHPKINPFMIMPLYFIRIGIIDARNGDVLAYDQVITTYDFGKEDDKKLVELLAKSLKKLPTGTAAEKK